MNKIIYLVTNVNHAVSQTDMHQYFLNFLDDVLEKKYIIYRIKRNINKIRLYYFSSVSMYIISLLGNYLFMEISADNNINLTIFYMKLALSSFLILFGLVILTDIYEKYYINITIFVKKFIKKNLIIN